MYQNIEDSDCLAAFTGLDPVFCLDLYQKTVIYGSHSGILKTFSAENGAVEGNLKGHTGNVKQLCVVPDDDDSGGRLYSAGADGVVRAWDLILYTCVAKSAPVGSSVETLHYSPGKGDTQTFLLLGCADGTVHFLTPDTLALAHTLRLHTGRVGGLRRVGDLLYSCSADGLAKAVDLQKSQLASVFEGTAAVRCMEFCPPAEETDDAPLLALGCSDNVIRLYDSRSTTCVKRLAGHTELVTQLRTVGTLLFSASEDGTVRQWSLEAGACEYTFQGHSASVTGLCLSSDGQLFSGSIDKSIRLWDRDGAQERLRVQRLLDPTGYTPKFAFAAKTGAALISRAALTSASSAKRPAPKSASSRASRPSSGTTRPGSSTSRPSSGASSPKTSRAKERLETELFEFRTGHLASIHTTFLKYMEETGTLLFPEFQRCLAFLGVSQLPLVEKVFSVYMTQTGSTRRFPYRPFIQEVHDLVDGPSQERVYRLCWNLYDSRRAGLLLRSEMERWRDDPRNVRAGRSPMQVGELLDLFPTTEIGDPELSFADFTDAMNHSPRLLQSFLPMVLLTLDRVVA
eukprot:EG_transcript_7007